MPEYLAPGVYVEETSFRAKSIEGVSTTTTGFIGPTRYGPVDLEPDIITGLGEFERVYGDRQQLKFTAADGAETLSHNFMWHAVRAFFENDGKRLYIVRTFKPISETDEGFASAIFPLSVNPEEQIEIRARFPGDAGRMRVRLTLRLGQNVLSGEPDNPSVSSLLNGDVVWISDLPGSPPSSPPSSESGQFYVANKKTEGGWEFTNLLTSPPSSPTSSRDLSTLRPDPDPKLSDKVKVLTLTVTTMLLGESDLPPGVWSGLALDPSHKTAGQPDSIFDKFAARPSNLSDARRLPIVIERGKNSAGTTNITDGIEVLERLLQHKPSLRAGLDNPNSTDDERSIDFVVDGGNDGQRPTAAEYEGEAEDDSPFKTGLKAFEDVEDISIVAAPGSTFGYENGYRQQAATIVSLLISHCERMLYRIAVLDSGDGQTISDVRAMRSRYDSKYAALYYPWVKILDPVTQTEIALPPSGFITGIYARNDVQRAVYKAPANEVVNLAIGFEQTLNKAQQEVLNPEGVNCLRFFEGRGFRVWGARTISSDPEWKYVNLRRYFAYLERSIDRGTQWAVFEPNGENLWANVRRTIETFLLNEFQMGALLGDRPEKAFFVRCDRTTMTQNDLDNGRLVCLIGVAPLRPAEFVIFRIGQWTADRK